MKIRYLLLLMTCANASVNFDDTWSKEYSLPGNKKCFITHQKRVCFSDSNRKNILNQSKDKQQESIINGSKHALVYPVKVSELQIPYETLLNLFQSKRIIFKIPMALKGIKKVDDIYKWIGLHKYPTHNDVKSPNYIFNIRKFDNERMGATIAHNENNTKLLTFGCASCHSSNLFGTKVLGMTNRFPRANEFFRNGKNLISVVSPKIFKALTNATNEEVKIYSKARKSTKYIGAKKPQVLGLDTSLAQVALSLTRRAKDPYATKTTTKVRKNLLSKIPADSKPAVWWNLKYKTKWLSDGSIRSGNPVHTNFLWNEIGRGTDLKELEKWLIDNKDIVDDLTTYVFNTEAPKYNDFFANSINIKKAKKGQKLYRKNCMNCHGDYEKAWTDSTLSYKKQLETKKIWYHTKTVTIDVKTDDHRYKGMQYFYKDLNRLKISKSIGTVVTPQTGYVPPPLVGIWARWPYLHNNSVPTLYDMLSPEDQRPKMFYAFEAKDKSKDFDKIKNGYPNKINSKKYLYNTQKPGLSNKGHNFMLIDADGNAKFSHLEKLEIIEFLKTL